jgi:hypothetical protein
MGPDNPCHDGYETLPAIFSMPVRIFRFEFPTFFPARQVPASAPDWGR